MATKTTHDFWVTVHGDRGREWLDVCGRAHFPIKSPIPVLADLPGHPNARVYLLNLDVIEGEVLAKIVAHLATKFGLSAAEAQQEISAVGIPILEDDCIITVLHPQRWMC